MDRAGQLGTLLGVPGGMELLASPGQSCPGEGWFADVVIEQNTELIVKESVHRTRPCNEHL